MTFKPTAALAYGTTYTATVTGAEDTDGDPMAAPVTWSFATDPTQPAVSSHTPASGATGVAVSATPTATFNEAVQSGTVTFTLATSTGTAVAGTASYSSTTNAVTFKPAAALAYGTTYTATVSGAEDTDGDPMAAPVTWSFTTDPTQPAVSSHTPASGTTGVAVSATPTATFNEAVQSGTITFTLATQYRNRRGWDRFLQLNNQCRDVHANRGTSIRHDLHGDRQRRRRHGRRSMGGPVTWSFTTTGRPSRPVPVPRHIPVEYPQLGLVLRQRNMADQQRRAQPNQHRRRRSQEGDDHQPDLPQQPHHHRRGPGQYLETTARAGVGLYTNTSTGDGYNLVFHGTNQVQFLDDGVAWGNSYTFDWQVGTWYWFQLEENNGTLYGKVWAAGTAEPQNWMFQQTGWTDRTSSAPRSTEVLARSHRLILRDVSVTTTSVQPDTANAGSALTATGEQRSLSARQRPRERRP